MSKFQTWRESAAARNDVRHTAVSDTPVTRSVPNKRDTKRFCKGKVGVEHKITVAPFSVLKNWRGSASMVSEYRGWLVRYCSTCGKQLAMYIPPWTSAPGLRYKHEVPEWAEAYFVEHPEERHVPRAV